MENAKATVPSALVTVGALSGLYYGVSRHKSFWVTALTTLVFAVGGAALGVAYQNLKS